MATLIRQTPPPRRRRSVMIDRCLGRPGDLAPIVDPAWRSHDPLRTADPCAACRAHRRRPHGAAALMGPPRAAAAPEGQLAWGIHITLVPTYFDPAETQGIVTPFMILYAL